MGPEVAKTSRLVAAGKSRQIEESGAIDFSNAILAHMTSLKPARVYVAPRPGSIQ